MKFSEIRGQEGAKRALEVAIAGGHHVILIGPPGAGKTSLATALPSIVPPPTPEELEEIEEVYSLSSWPLPEGVPVRMPPLTTSAKGIAGKGHPPTSGEVSLATGGLLILDDIHAFKRNALDALVGPMETRSVYLPPLGASLALPARFILVATGAACPCGYRGTRHHHCSCSKAAIGRHWRRVPSGLLDRLGLHIDVPEPTLSELRSGPGEASEAVRRRITNARKRQYRRSGLLNADLPRGKLLEVAAPDRGGQELLEAAFDRLGLSARAHRIILSVARTLADLAGSQRVRAPHVSEAIQYRRLDAWFPKPESPAAREGRGEQGVAG